MIIWSEPSCNISKTFKELLVDFNLLEVKDCLVNDENAYFGYLKFLKLIYNGNSIYFSDSKGECFYESIPAAIILNNEIDTDLKYDDFIQKLESNKKISKVFLMTSGTTGRPKIISKYLNELMINIKLNPYLMNKSWLLSYAPYHMAGLQVFLQAFFTKSKIVLFEKKSVTNFSEIISKESITHLALTPTFYKIVRNYIDVPLPQIEACSFGGEKLNEAVRKMALADFPSAKVRSIYASTEGGSLFSSNEKGFFQIPESLISKIKISESSELLIHQSIVGDGVICNGEWYHTGDIVELNDLNQFLFVGRRTDFINVGGYKVNPHNVENVLMEHPAIKLVRVYGRENKITGFILAAEIELNESMKDIDKTELKKEFLHRCRIRLNEWEVPRLISFNEEILETKTGKVVR